MAASPANKAVSPTVVATQGNPTAIASPKLLGDLARQLGISNGKVHYLIAALVEKGLLKMGHFGRTGGKLSKVAYLLTPEGVKNRALLTRDYLARKEAEYEALKAEISALRKTQTEMPGDAALTPE